MRKLSKLGISVLDTDLIVKSAVSPTLHEPTLLEKILSVGDKFYIHSQIRKEVEWPQETADLLDRLIREHHIKMVDDRGLLERLDKYFPMPVRTFLGNLKECCEMFGTYYYEDYYKRLESLLLNESNIELFCAKLAAVEEKIKQDSKSEGRSTNLGEIKTALSAAIFSLSNMERVTIFMSDDRRARNLIVSRYSEKYHEIKAISVIGTFYILMKNGMPLEEARRYVGALEAKEYKLFDKREKMTGLEIVKGIYANKLVLLANGMLEWRD
ncbi:hypothetical protein CULT_420044 [[Clostridium] ultunense Esp]|nr:hypothetical protein CULT_420044 [[Clostridium] ultunense Esp]